MCHSCSAGTYQPSTGGTSCIDCIEGRAESRSAQSSCRDCIAGKYSAPGSSACLACAEKTWSKPASGSCELCTSGYFRDLSGTCEKCSSEGVVCNEVGQTILGLKIKEGYYRISSSAVEIRACLSLSGCVGGNVSELYCRKGHSGPLCEVGSFCAISGSTMCEFCDVSVFVARFLLLFCCYRYVFQVFTQLPEKPFAKFAIMRFIWSVSLRFLSCCFWRPFCATIAVEGRNANRCTSPHVLLELH